MSDELFATIESLEGECAAYREDIQRLTKQRDDLREALTTLCKNISPFGRELHADDETLHIIAMQLRPEIADAYQAALANLNKTDPNH